MCESLVISGISGRYPEAINLEQFWSNLLVGKDCVKVVGKGWPLESPRISPRVGKLVDCDLFDGEFFQLSKEKIDNMRVCMRLLHEVIYETLVDAGISYNLRNQNTRTGFFYVTKDQKSIKNDSEFYDHSDLSWLTNHFNITGPTVLVDTACASSGSALDIAINSIRAGDCDQAIVAGFNFCEDPDTSRSFVGLGAGSIDGKSKCLDEKADGYCRSESVVAMLVQRQSNAKRIYASIVNMATNCDGYTYEGINFPKKETQRDLLTGLFEKIKLSPLEINYVEGHITGTQAGDLVECESICASVRPNSEKPLLLGCLKSNIGHGEGLSGLNAISKVVKIFQTGLIPRNLHYTKQNPKIDGLAKGILKPVLTNTQFNDNLILINTFGYGGANHAIILKANPKRIKEDDKKLSAKYLPRLVNFSNRSQAGLHAIIDFLNTQKGSLTKYTLALLNNMSKLTPSMGFNHRGYLLLNGEQTIIHKTLRQNLSPDKMSPWFIFTPMFDVSLQLFNQLLNLPLIYSRVISMQTKQLTSHGIDVIKMIKSNQKDLTSFLISSIAIQIALSDILTKKLGIKPEGIIGHSIGLIAAAYSDNCITDEDALLIGYHIGEACKQFKGQSAMVCVNLSWEQIEKMKPNGVEIVSHEAEDWTMVTGKNELIDILVKNIDHKVKTYFVDTRGIPFNSFLISSYLQSAEVEINKFLTPKSVHSSKLLVTFSQVAKKLDIVQNFAVDAKFFINGLISPYYLHEIKDLLPSNFLNLTIGSSHQNGLSNGNSSIQLINKLPHEIIENQYSPMILNLYKAFGEIYLHGLDPMIENLYEPIEYPVPRETQPISHLIKWKHDVKYFLTRYKTNLSNISKSYIEIDLMQPGWNFINGHKIDGRILLPATGYLYLAWRLICFAYDVNENKQSIEFYEVNLLRATHFASNSSSVKCFAKLNRDLNTFKLYMDTESEVCVIGKYRLVSHQRKTCETFVNNNQEIILDANDAYKELRIRGYDYSGEFQGIEKISSRGTWGLVKNTGHWISFSDSCLQIPILATNSRKLLIPIYIEYAYLDPPYKMDSDKNQTTGSTESFQVFFDPATKVTSTKGLIMKNIVCEELKRKLPHDNTKIYIHNHFPFDSEHKLSIDNQNSQNSYSSNCLELIKILNDFSSKERINWDKNHEEKINHYLINDHSSHSLMRILLETLKKIQSYSGDTSDFNIKDELNSVYQQYQRTLVEDDLFKTPLSILYDQMMSIIQFNLKTRSNSIAAVNFQRIPSEIILEELQSFSLMINSVQYYFLMNYSNPPICDTEYSVKEIDVMLNDKVFSSQKLKIIVTRDKSTYSMLPDSTPQVKCNQFDLPFFRAIFDSLDEGGFCMILTRSKLTPVELEWQKLIGNNQEINLDLTKLKSVTDEIGFTWICCKEMTNEGYCSVLLRRPFVANLKLSFIRISLNKFDWIDKIKEAGKNENHKIWLIGGGHDNGLTGLAKALIFDPHGYKVRCYYDPAKGDDEEIIVPDEILVKDLTLNQVDSNGKVGLFKSQLVDINEPKAETSSCYADVKIKGNLSSLRWFQSAHSNWTHIPQEKLIVEHAKVTIYYGALNFKDILVATGRVPLRSYVLEEKIQHAPTIGLEYSGIDSSGNRIMGLTDVGGIGTTLVAYSSYAKIRVPDKWTLAEAATVPVVYLTAYYGLISRGDLKNGESVLIHAGSGGVGQAAISICLARGCEVFTTVGTREKRDFIRKQFPTIDDNHIGDSRSTSFEEMVMKMTNGRGVDLVLNSLSDEKMTASMRCLTDFGRFIEIAKYDMIQNTKMNSNSMDFNKTFHACCLAFLQDEVLRQKVPERISLWNQLIIMINEGIKSGEVVPLPSTIFRMDQLEESFRFMATGKHIGKVLIQMRDETEDPNVVKLYPAIGQTFFDLEKSYIITGGLGGLGLEVAYWMVQRGATNLILTSRSGVKTKYQEYMLDKIRNNNYTRTNVLISNEDCYTYESAERLINSAKDLGQIGGIFLSALVLRDALFENRTVESFTEVINPKSISCLHLDKLTRLLPYKLDYFVGFSSIANEFGNVGQDNYCYGNASVENICYKRRLDGHHGLAIRWGRIGDVGAVAEDMIKLSEAANDFEITRLPLVLTTLDKVLCHDGEIYSIITLSDSKKMNVVNTLSFKQQILNVLGIKDERRVDPKMKLGELGLDSLMAVEIRQILEAKYELLLGVQEIRDLTIEELDQFEVALNKPGDQLLSPETQNQSYLTISTTIFAPLNKCLTGSPFFYLPDINGIHDGDKIVFESLSRPVIAFNWVKELQNLKSTEEIVDYFVSSLLTTYPDEKSYNFIGHSFGGVIAIKVAIALQKKNGIDSCQNLIILDPSPEIILKMKGNRCKYDENYSSWMLPLISQMIGSDAKKQIESKFSSLETEGNKLEYFNSLVTTLPQSKQKQITEAIEFRNFKQNLTLSLKLDEKFIGNISLIRSSEIDALKYSDFINQFNLQDYGLSECVTGKISVAQVPGTSDTFMGNGGKQIANLII